jgi:Tfp pilus assembly protein FimT
MFIVAMVVAVALPSFVRAYNSAVLSETARTFATTCLLARVQAVSQQQPATLHIDVDRQMFWVTQPIKTSDEPAGGEQTIKVVEIPKRISLVSVERADGSARQEKLVEATFYPNGTCDSVTVVFRGSERTGLTATLDPMTCQANPYPVK